ncbi:hypothetical protein EGO58_08055 [Limosilactobacillus reuteri]|uniref:hypothetical protein n=1 Tax=Limosilactobacillus reuteri TaxID=1598 RepID=UPI000F50B624|nr:hypothetical protein [Limosilactobacillus reuteri]MCT3200481.1 hypothetical protein [Limosilactobacillus reuteri]MDZ5438848.1 hypothetical protein [Limosilactobacillus reuteri]ROV62675.1 hypothetical protein EGO58_08055 [Limosilactobacillus reuteri]UNL39733.1 hypothetical protein G8B24_00195 [Limosilactobacillus reuteri]
MREMKMKTPVQMTDDLAHFIKETREDAAFPHESLYVDLLEQWKVLSRYQLEYADKESKRLYNAYWNSMSHWYKIFDKEREHLLEPTALPSEDLMDFYAGLIEDLMDHVLSLVPPVPHSTIIKLTDFRVLLSNELQKITQLDLEIQGPIDFAMIMDYWKMLGESFDREKIK